jgi:hypothetical protein
MVTIEMVSLAPPALVTVSVWGALGAPTFCAPNARLVAERVTAGGDGSKRAKGDKEGVLAQAVVVAVSTLVVS